MKKIIISLALILAVGGIVAIGGTGAFLSDTETSTDNTFTAGAIDLKVDNESYYNGEIYPSATWQLDDLDKGLLFFNFRDLKPDDEGEDTISLHVNNNDAWLCMDMTLTSNDDISSNNPELKAGDVPEDANNTWDGEVGDLINMIWWVDDGDNVLEAGESLLNGGVKTVKEFFGDDKVFSADLADATTNVWTGAPGPVVGSQDYYIAKAWCYGAMAEARIAQDGLGKTGSNGPLARGTGVTCDGESLGNESQTDGVTMDIAFRAMQARHNAGYTCGEEQPRTAKLTVIKEIINNNGGNNVKADYQLKVVGTVVTNVTSGVQTDFAAGDYTITETGVNGYQAAFAGDCNIGGQITLNPGDEKTCTVTNDDIAPNITLFKNVINDDGGTADQAQFTMQIDGVVVPQSSSVPVTANSAHSINELSVDGYHFVSITGSAKCPSDLGGTVTLDEGEAITCTITNSDIGTQ